MSKVNCAPGRGQGKVWFFFKVPSPGFSTMVKLFNAGSGINDSKGTWGPVSSPFQKVQQSFEKGFCSHCTLVSNSFAGSSFARNSRHPYHFTVKTAAASEQRLPASESHLMFLLISSNRSLWMTQKLVIYALKMKGRSNLKELMRQGKGWTCYFKKFVLGVELPDSLAGIWQWCVCLKEQPLTQLA